MEQSFLLICVKYGGDEETERYLESLRAQESLHALHVLVVDNSADSKWMPNVPELRCQAVRRPANPGYLGGARCGLSAYLEQNVMPDWVVISNVDLILSGTQFLMRLSKLASLSDLGAVAPSICSDLTGIDQNPYMKTRPSKLRMHAYKWLYRNWLVLNMHELGAAVFHRLQTALMGSRKSPDQSVRCSQQTIYAPHGSMIILSRQYFERGGDLNFPEFLFGEEIYIAEKVRSLGLKVVYEPRLKVIHEEHHSTKLLKSRKIAAYAAASAAYCADSLFPFRPQQSR